MLPFKCQAYQEEQKRKQMLPQVGAVTFFVRFFFFFFPESRVSKSQGKNYRDEGDLVEKVTAPYVATACPGCSLAPRRHVKKTAVQTINKTSASRTLNVAKIV